MNEWQRKKELRKKWQRQLLPGYVVEAPPPEAGCKVVHGTYTAKNGIEIPVEIHAHPGGLIERLWKEEAERRNSGVTIKIATAIEIQDKPISLPPIAKELE